MPRNTLHVVCKCDLVNRLVNNLTSQQSALQLLPQQASLSLGSLHEAAVLLSTAGQVGDYFIDRAVRNVFIDRKTCLACFQIREGDSVFTVSTMCEFGVMSWCITACSRYILFIIQEYIKLTITNEVNKKKRVPSCIHTCTEALSFPNNS